MCFGKVRCRLGRGIFTGLAARGARWLRARGLFVSSTRWMPLVVAPDASYVSAIALLFGLFWSLLALLLSLLYLFPILSFGVWPTSSSPFSSLFPPLRLPNFLRPTYIPLFSS